MNATARADRVEVVVAFGRSIVDATGNQIPAGNTAIVGTDELPRLIAQGFVVDPNDAVAQEGTKHSAEAARIAANIGRLTQNAAAVAFGLRPNEEAGILRARHFLKSIETLQAQAQQLVRVLESRIVAAEPKLQ